MNVIANKFTENLTHTNTNSLEEHHFEKAAMVALHNWLRVFYAQCCVSVDDVGTAPMHSLHYQVNDWSRHPCWPTATAYGRRTDGSYIELAERAHDTQCRAS